MSRRALMICNPGEKGAENYCEGVYVDMRKYSRLLTSPCGGAWENAELEVLERPLKATVREALERLQDKAYSFVVFSGHGWYSSIDKCNVLVLRNGHEIASHELLRGAEKHTAIFDACREVHHETITESEKRTLFMSKAAAAVQRRPDPRKCRSHFTRMVNSASVGVVEITSCDLNETAGDDPKQGGRYSSSLIAVADAWAVDESKKYSWSADADLSIVAAHAPAVDQTRRSSGGRQNPQISKPRTANNYFPFAVFAS